MPCYKVTFDCLWPCTEWYLARFALCVAFGVGDDSARGVCVRLKITKRVTQLVAALDGDVARTLTAHQA